MRLTLRTMFAFRHGILSAAETREMAGRIEQSEFARQQLARAENVLVREDDLLAAPDADRRHAELNTVAEYVDNVLEPMDVAEFESLCLESDEVFAELVAVHQIVARVLSQPVKINEQMRSRLYAVPIESGHIEPAVISPEPAAWQPLASSVAPTVASPPIAAPPVAPPQWASPPSLPPPIALLPDTNHDAALPDLAPGARVRDLPERLWHRALSACSQQARYYVQSTLVHLLLFIVAAMVAGRFELFKPKNERPIFDTVLDASLGEPDSPVFDLGAAPLASSVPDAATPEESQRTSLESFAETLDKSDLLQPEAASRPGSPRALSLGPTMTGPSSSQVAMHESPKWTRELGKEIRGAGRPSSSGLVRPRSSATSGGVVAAQGVEGAVDGILSSIQGELVADDLLVVWLLDASLSLYDDRQQVAARIEPFYRQIDGKHAQSHLLMNAAVAFGAVTAELVAPTRFGLAMVEAVSKTPIDTTGLENVMTAVEQCVRKYRKNWKGSILIVIWTDESGDDTWRLEEIIAMCRREKVVVSVVGPTSAFGSEMGVHPYRDNATGYRFLLPIKRGPDTSYAERLQLPYWHDSPLAPWTRGGAQIAEGAAWYGGPYREGLLSGVGPYALTRLALETGGKFTLLDHVGTGGPFNFEAMKRYLPDYGPANEYLKSINRRSLRKAIFDVVQLTYKQQEAIALPKLSFESQRRPYYPFSIRDLYFTPAQFRQGLPNLFAVEAVGMSATSAVVEQGLARFGPDGMEQDYLSEQSPRWRAWYDLTRGRLLAMSVRFVEYSQTCNWVLSQLPQLNPETNHIHFEPSSKLKSESSDVRKRVAEAERLLNRCIEQNPDTPWAQLAQWELDHPLGLSVREVVIPAPPPPMPRLAAPAAAPAAMPSLPSL